MSDRPLECCKNCEKAGLPILPVRYTVLPKSVKAKLPGDITGDRVTSVPLSEHGYGLRILREGWLYLFYPKCNRGVNQWDVYRVSEDGRLWLQKLPTPTIPITHPACVKSGVAAPMDIITIEQPSLCDEAYIAFSGEVWTDEIVKRYEEDADLRKKRMQCIEPAKWIAGGVDKHATVATESSIDDVIEYMPGFDPKILQPPPELKVSDATGEHKQDVLTREATLYPLHIRQATPDSASKALLGVMREIAKKEEGNSNYPPMLLAVWDAVGNVHELNGFRNDPVSWFHQYVDAEHSLKVSALHDIDKAHAIVQSRKNDELTAREAMVKQVHDMTPLGSPGAQAALAAQRAKALDGQSPARAAQINAWYDDMDWMAANDIPGSYQQRVIQLGQLSSAGENGSIQSYTGSYRDSIMQEAQQYHAAQPGAHDRSLNQMTEYAWSKYEARLRRPDIESFREKYKKLQSAVYQLQEIRSADVGQWIKAPLLLDTLEDYGSPNILDIFTFELVVSEALFGLASTVTGKTVIDGLVVQWDATQRSSLIWRVMGVNQMDACQDLHQLLERAQKEKSTPLDKTGDMVASIAGAAKSVINRYKDLSKLAQETDPNRL